MIETGTNNRRVERAYLVGVYFDRDDAVTAGYHLDELVELVDTFGAERVGRQLVRAGEPQPKFLIGSGKTDEVIASAKKAGADVIILDNALSPAQQRNWEKQSGLAVIDREEVILDIFAARAQTREARLQVGLALMEYSLPRLTRAWGHLGRQGGALGAKGEGETQLEIDRRIIRKRIDRFRAELEEVRQNRATQRKQRGKRPTPVAAIVGYTNAGKSSLLRSITGADVLVEDRLFATLDTTTRRVELPNGQPLLLTDTVGFVRKLPHRLVEAFKATLEEAVLADYLIHVLDINSPHIQDFYDTTRTVLQELGAERKPGVIVLNKCDLLPDPAQVAHVRQRFPDAVPLSTITGEGIPDLMEHLAALTSLSLQRVRLEVPHHRSDVVAEIHRQGRVLSAEYGNESTIVHAEIPTRTASKFREFHKAE
jgi:GTP-binding protein HflX